MPKHYKDMMDEIINKIDEDAPTNAVAHGGVDMNPTGKKTKLIKKKDDILKRVGVKIKENNDDNNIVLINDQSQDKIDNIISTFNNLKIKFVRGDYSMDLILDKANASKASFALLLNNHKNNEDEKVILTTLTLKKISANIRVIAQIDNQEKATFLKRANVDAILSNEEFNSFMATSHILQPSVAQTISDIIDVNSNNLIEEAIIPEEYIGKPFSELHNYFFSTTGSICLGLFNHEKNMGISDFLSSDSSVLDKFIEDKLKKAGHSLNEKNNINLMLNPKKNELIQKEQGAILLK